MANRPRCLWKASSSWPAARAWPGSWGACGARPRPGRGAAGPGEGRGEDGDGGGRGDVGCASDTTRNTNIRFFRGVPRPNEDQPSWSWGGLSKRPCEGFSTSVSRKGSNCGWREIHFAPAFTNPATMASHGFKVAQAGFRPSTVFFCQRSRSTSYTVLVGASI